MIAAPPPPPPAVAQAFEPEDDDDLPRPGKVWTASAGPSLSDLLKQQAATAVAAAPAVKPGPVDASDLWPRFLARLAEQNSALGGPLSLASLVGIEDNQAIIRFQLAGATFAEKWATNGKKDTIAKALSELRGSPLGVRFEVEEAVAAAAPAPKAPPLQAAAPPVQNRPAAPVVAAPPPVARPSPELMQEIQADPLVQNVLKEFGGTIIKVE